MIFSIILNIKFALDLLVPVVITLALIYFIWGITQYVIAQSDEKKADAKAHIIYGIIAMFVIVSIWGITDFIADYLGIIPFTYPIIPKIPHVNIP
jgi:hypothetical protein